MGQSVSGRAGVCTFVLDAIPQSGKAHEAAVFSPDEMGQLVPGPGLEPLEESLGNDYAALLVLHGRPHAAGGAEGILAAVDGPHEGLVVGVSLGPERNKTPFHGLQLVLDLARGGSGSGSGSILFSSILFSWRGLVAVAVVALGLVRSGPGARPPIRGIGSVDDAVVSGSKVV